MGSPGGNMCGARGGRKEAIKRVGGAVAACTPSRELRAAGANTRKGNGISFNRRGQYRGEFRRAVVYTRHRALRVKIDPATDTES